MIFFGSFYLFLFHNIPKTHKNVDLGAEMLYNGMSKKGEAMLPEKFKERMKSILGNEYDEFISALTDKKAKKGFRVNPLKTDTNEFSKNNRLPALPLDYVKDGYLLTEDVPGIGNMPMHAAGQIYVQDPGAMASAAALDIKPGMKVCDLCAAPGGKSTQAASALGNEGFLLSNEYVPKRAKILVGNFERMGIRCGAVTSLDTKEIANFYENYFDIVIADAPCSGEGMFRKDVPAIEEWSEENVKMCAQRQAQILENAAKILADGGVLLYSTCTYSVEENEAVVDAFLKSHPEFSLCDVKESLAKITADGIVFDGAQSKELYKCRRFYPHRAEGEGQFLALMRKKNAHGVRLAPKDTSKSPTKDELSAINDFFVKNLKKAPDGKIVKHGENLVIISHDCPLPPKSVFSAGVLIGEVRGKILFPSHQFFSAYGELFKRKQVLDYDSAIRYMRGEQIAACDFSDNGFCVMIYNSSVIGGGKMSNGIINNHYPKGLRIN